MVVFLWLSVRLLSLYIHALLLGFHWSVGFRLSSWEAFYADFRLGWASIASSSVEGAALGLDSFEGFHLARR